MENEHLGRLDQVRQSNKLIQNEQFIHHLIIRENTFFMAHKSAEVFSGPKTSKEVFIAARMVSGVEGS